MINIPGNPDNYPANVRAIEDGDKRGEVNLAAATEDLSDRTAFLNKRLGGAASGVGVTYPIPMSAVVPLADLGTVDWLSVSLHDAGVRESHPGLMTNAGISMTVPHSFVVPLSPFLPPAGVLREFAMDFQGYASYTQTPQHTTIARLYNYDVESLELTKFVGPGEEIECFDTALTVTEYRARHTVGYNALSGGSYQIINLAVYRNLFLRVESEYGDYAQTRGVYSNIRCLVAKAGWT